MWVGTRLLVDRTRAHTISKKLWCELELDDALA